MMADLFDTPADTRAAAYDAIKPASNVIRAKVLRYLTKLHSAGGKGMTADECADALGMDRLTVRPRFTELKAAGLIRDTGVRRKNASGKAAKVWTLDEGLGG